MNRFVWDYRYPPPTKLEDRELDTRTARVDAAVPPKAIPGNYRVRLSVGDQRLEQPFVISPDPRLPVSEDDLRAQFELKVAIRDRLSETHDALNQVVRVRRQLEEWERRGRRLQPAAQALRDELSEIEAELVGSSVNSSKPRPGPSKIKEKLGTLSSMIDESDHAPTAGAQEVYALLRDQLEQQRQRLATVLNERLPAFAELIASESVPAIAP
jgi:hypothetical protein